MGVNRILRIDFDSAGDPETYVAQALAGFASGLSNSGERFLPLVTRLVSSSITPRISPSSIRWTGYLSKSLTRLIGLAMPSC
jgi:hypothetical protein